jgi:hypothetical protein
VVGYLGRVKVKANQILHRPVSGLEESRRLSFPDFETFGL